MNKYYLQSQIKSTGTAYLLYFLLFGTLYIYLGKWLYQILYWITLGGFGIWMILDLFLIPGKISRHNSTIFKKIDEIERKEKTDELTKHLAIINASKGV